MAFTTTEVNGWFQTIDGLPPTTASISSSLATMYVGELNATPPTATPGDIQANLENFAAPPEPHPSILRVCFIARALRNSFSVNFRPRGAWFLAPARARSMTIGWPALLRIPRWRVAA